MPRADVPRVLPLWLTVLLGLAGAAGAVWGLHAAAWLLAPVLLAFVLTVVAHPVVGALTRRGVPRWLAVAVLVVVVDGGVVAFALAVVVSVGQLATVLPDYADAWQQQLAGLRSTLASLGIGRDQAQQMLAAIGPEPVLAALGSLLSGTVSALGGLVLLLATALFMAVDGAGLPERLAAVPRVPAGLPAALHDFARGTRRYVVITSVFGLAVAVVDAVGLYLLGVPLAVLWGLVSFLTNYVPNIGFLVGLVPPTLLALLVGGPGLAVAVVVLYSVANFVLQSMVQPLFVGDAVSLSVTLTFLSTLAWTVVLGPVGAILAIPLTLLATAVLVGQDPERRWARVLLAGASGAASGGGSSAGDDAVPVPRREAASPSRIAPVGGRRGHDRPAGRPAPSSPSARPPEEEPP